MALASWGYSLVVDLIQNKKNRDAFPSWSLGRRDMMKIKVIISLELYFIHKLYHFEEGFG